jgi:hypothetical protein
MGYQIPRQRNPVLTEAWCGIPAPEVGALPNAINVLMVAEFYAMSRDAEF